MLGKDMLSTANDLNKEECRKRKLSFTDECDLNMVTQTSKKLKKKLLTNDSLNSQATENDLPKIYFKSSKSYIKVVAKPGSLPSTPKIFECNGDGSKALDTSDSFFYNLLTAKTFSTDSNGRFSNIIFNKSESKKKINKIKKHKEEKTPEEVLEMPIKNKEKEKKKMKKEIQTELMKLNEANFTNDDRTEEKCSRKNDEYENKKSHVDLYKVINKNALIFHMHHPSKFSFHGELRVTIISGEVEILGYTLNPSSVRTSVDIYSPNFYTALTVETKLSNQNKTTEELQMCLKDILTEEDYCKLISDLKPNNCILYVEPVVSTFGIVLNKYFNKQLFPKDLEDVSSASETLKTLQGVFTFNLSKKGKHIKKSPKWDNIPIHQCTVLCGGKGVGKSTLLKYYVNKLVSLGEKVLCLDLDPGQPEFTFPGCISAVIIDQPLLGPNFTHILNPVVMTSFGDVDVSQNPGKYLDCVKYVIETCQKDMELLKIKWFVNTMGFCKGVGVNLIISIIKLLKPDSVIQIKSSDYKYNFPFYLTSSTVNSRQGFSSMSDDIFDLYYNLSTIFSSAEHEKKQLQGGLKNRELRDVMSISYFSQMVSPPFYNFNAVLPYLISFSKLYLGIDFVIDPNDVLKAFNGNTVSLSHFEPDDEEIFSVHSQEDDYFKVVIKPKISPCLGIGFIRGIDCKEKKFYLITPLPLESLDNVNCLSLGRVSPPHSLFLRQDTVEGEAVYTTQGTFNVFQKVRRIFRVPGTPQIAEKASV